ncbi:MAG: thrombospondin type 3 repeat-containing protein [bacterium]|nr:thrombospondin type 3 repeat-containing protein [bacterium]
MKPTALKGVAIHVMPKEFYGSPGAMTPVEKKPEQKPVFIPPKLAEQAPLPKPTPQKAPIPPVKPARRKYGLLAVFVLFAVIAITASLFLLFFEPAEAPENSVIVADPQADIPIPPPPIVPVDPVVTRGIDTDSDGLSDREEVLYGTDFRNPDTDADTFLDGNEVFHGYDPLGFRPRTLMDTGTVAEFVNDEQGYSILYPNRWTLEVRENGMFVETTTSATMEVVTIEKAEEERFDEWYLAQNTEEIFTQLSVFPTRMGYQAYMSEDGTSAYLDFMGSVMVFDYDLQDELTIDFIQTFHMMLNSVKRFEEQL